MFPIFNFSEKVVGFGGREINNNSKIKYINSQESEIFRKSEILYGLKQNNESIRKNKTIILVEGYMDVISMAENDINLAVASLGTTLSKIQIQKMWNFCSIPYICFDGDEAGRKSSKIVALKILEFLVPGNLLNLLSYQKIMILTVFLKNGIKKNFEELMNKSYDLSDLVWQIILESIEKPTPEFIALIDEKIKYYSSKISNKIVSEEYYRFFMKKRVIIYGILNLIKRRSILTRKKYKNLLTKNLL